MIGGKPASAYSDEWYTPEPLVKALGTFDLDPCAGPKNHAKRNIRKPKNGLRAKWAGRVWLNPPYSNVHEWLAKMCKHKNGIALVNARVETQWFQIMAESAHSLFFPRGRIKFTRPDGTSGGVPVGSVLVCFSEQDSCAVKASGLRGIHCTL
jgi:phage N-6-adenine-methyltransferase